ncbi:MAG: hypothetical protein DMD75_07130 [Candidatus Rokuibacteriota bacterium]|nr:MAG: hypothetical protein DMD75_07130 [Candidatus Rokubacteria bacterium]
MYRVHSANCLETETPNVYESFRSSRAGISRSWLPEYTPPTSVVYQGFADFASAARSSSGFSAGFSWAVAGSDARTVPLRTVAKRSVVHGLVPRISGWLCAS